LHTVDLNSNKWLFIVSLFSSLVSIAISYFDSLFLQPFRWIGIFIALLTCLLFFMLYLNKLFVHVDRAGVSYGLVFKVKYIHQESIKSVDKKNSIFGNVLELVTRDGRVKSFYAWRLTNEELEKSQRLLNL